MKKQTSKKSPKKNVKAVKRGKPKAAKIIDDNVNNNENAIIVEKPSEPTPAINETVVVAEPATTIEEVIEQTKNVEQEASTTSNTENTSNTTVSSADIVQTESASYADIKVPETKDRTVFYIGILVAVTMLVWSFFL